MQVRTSKSGFTLMEIMVVIIVIAVLASVAGPMIGSITDQGKASASKASMQNLKTAFVNFANDMGKAPHMSNALTAANFNAGWSTTAANFRLSASCPFVNAGITPSGWNNMNITWATYNKRWKGPYIDGNIEQFFQDSWEGDVKCYYWANGSNKGLWLQSAGADGNYDGAAAATAAGYGSADTEDDIMMSISKVKFN